MSAAETRTRILEAAAPIFAAEGFAGASTRTLAAAAGVNVATLAWHFGDKQGLYDALVDRVYERLLAVPLPYVPGAEPRERLRATVRAAYVFARENRVEVQVLLRHVLDHRHLPPQVQAKWMTALLGRVDEAWRTVGLPLDEEGLLGLLTLNHLVVRYALSEPADLAPFTRARDPHERIAEHLADVACALFGV